jgi:hypothetical protein
MRIVIELDEVRRDRPLGTIAWPGMDQSFEGWVQLLHLLEAAFRSIATPDEGESRDSPGATGVPDP